MRLFLSLKLYNLLIILLFTFNLNCGNHKDKKPKIIIVETGVASWYGKKFNGRKTASGEIFNMNELTAAHKYLQFGTLVKVLNLKNKKEVVVEINDRGPFIKKRVIDLSRNAAKKIKMLKSGHEKVSISIYGYETGSFSTVIKHFKNLTFLRKQNK